MNEIQVIQGIEGYEKDGIVYLRLETVARGLGFTKTDKKVNSEGQVIEYVRIDWPRIEGYLRDFRKDVSESEQRPEFITENVFYRLAMKAKNEVAEAFQTKVA